MTVLLYDYRVLEERAGRHLKVWKVWHLILYSLAAVFGLLNYIALQSAMQLIDNNCILYPRELSFHMVLRSDANVSYPLNTTVTSTDEATNDAATETTPQAPTAQFTVQDNSTEKIVTKRETVDNETMDDFETTIEIQNVTIVTGNQTHRLVLDVSRSLFARSNDCQFAEYMPIMSMMCALVWITFFTMCPGGGRPRSGLKQPWRILTPALLFALVLVGLTGHSFSRTNGGLHQFCAAFYNVTNSTTCSTAEKFIERESSWGLGARVAGARASSAAAWAGWACVAALLLARCLAAPDFHVKKTAVFLVSDPQGKVTPYLRKSNRSSRRSVPASPSRLEDESVRSEPTVVTELATVSADPEQGDSAPTSLMATPVKKEHNTDMIEMTYTPDEIRLNR